MENEKEYWIFTFGCGQPHAGHYVKIYGTYEETRAKMFERFGSQWGFQYSAKSWADWEKNRPPYCEPEKELGVID